MCYEEFKAELTAHLKEYLPEQYQSWSVFTETIDKINERTDAVTLVANQQVCAVPTLYVKKFYQQHQAGLCVEEAIRSAAEEFLCGLAYLQEISPLAGLEHPLGRIIYVLVNTEKNRHMLDGIPHREVMDLSLIYRLMIEVPGEGFNTAVITDEIAASFGLCEEELYQLAVGNTRRLMPLETMRLGENFYLIGNEKHLLGAVAMLYDDVLAVTAEKTGGDLYIIPSSIHEVFAISARGVSADTLHSAVCAANRSVVESNEVLSDHVYFYDKNNSCLSLVK